MGLSHRDMARRIWNVVANTLNNSRGQTERDGPPAWGLDELLATPHRKNGSCYEIFS